MTAALQQPAVVGEGSHVVGLIDPEVAWLCRARMTAAGEPNSGPSCCSSEGPEHRRVSTLTPTSLTERMIPRLMDTEKASKQLREQASEADTFDHASTALPL